EGVRFLAGVPAPWLPDRDERDYRRGQEIQRRAAARLPGHDCLDAAGYRGSGALALEHDHGVPDRPLGPDRQRARLADFPAALWLYRNSGADWSGGDSDAQYLDSD